MAALVALYQSLTSKTGVFTVLVSAKQDDSTSEKDHR